MSRLPIIGVNQGDGEESLRDGAIPKDDLPVAQICQHRVRAVR